MLFLIVPLLASVACGGDGRGRAGVDQALSAETTTTVVPSTETTTTTSTTTTTTAPPPPTTDAPTTTAARQVTAAAAKKPVTTTTPRAAAASRSAPRSRSAPPRPGVDSIAPYHGLGTWVDVYDWSHYRGRTPSVGPGDVDRMAEEGVQTLYIQTAKHDTPDDILERELLEPIIERARVRGLRVVAWYLPTLEDPANDLRRLVASSQLDVDGLAVDIEARNVRDVAERNRRLVDLSAALADALPGRALGAIVLPPVVLEAINPAYWPDFPYREIEPYYDVWMTMGYWTNRKASSEYRDAYRYTEENLRRLKNNLGQPNAPVHPIGGIGDNTTAPDLDGFARAAAAHSAVGGSIYDWNTTKPSAWASLRGFRS